MRFYLLALLISSTIFAAAQDDTVEITDDGVRVSVLGYHDFHSTQSATDMLIPTQKFRKQMSMIKDSGIPVISMEQFIAWRKGESTIPAQSYLITIDDGWKSVYEEAYPVLKEFEFPFTIFLYKNYVGANRGGKALTLPMIREMVDSKLCTIGSHSVSHPRPSTVRASRRGPSDRYQKFLQTELGDSKSFLEETFQMEVNTYAYPGGIFTEEMFPLADQLGYRGLFTVKSGKVKSNSPSHTLPRYIVLGNHDGAFNAAQIFRNVQHATPVQQTLPYPVSPTSGSLVGSRLPEIQVDLSKIRDLDPSSVIMRVGGFGSVPVQNEPGHQVYRWTVTRPLRQPMCQVTVQWRLKTKEQYEPVMRWSFLLDRIATYQSQQANLEKQ